MSGYDEALRDAVAEGVRRGWGQMKTPQEFMAEARCEWEHPERFTPGYPCLPCTKWSRSAPIEDWALRAVETEIAALRSPQTAWMDLLAGHGVEAPASPLDYTDADQIGRVVDVNGLRWVVLLRRAEVEEHSLAALLADVSEDAS